MRKFKFTPNLQKSLAATFLAAFLIFFMINISPYNAEGSMNALSILFVAITASAIVFLALQIVCSVMRLQSTNRIAFLGSFVIAQFFLLQSASFFSFPAILAILLFNALITWYAFKAL